MARTGRPGMFVRQKDEVRRRVHRSHKHKKPRNHNGCRAFKCHKTGKSNHI